MILALTFFLNFEILKRLNLYKHKIHKGLQKIWKTIKPFLNWKILLCYLPVYMLHNGIWYILAIVGKGWLKKFAIGWLVWLYSPLCAEQLWIASISLWLYKKIFLKKTDQKEMKVFENIIKKEKQTKK